MFARRAGPGGPDDLPSAAEVALTYNAATTWDSTHYIASGSRPDSMICSRSRRRAWPVAAMGSTRRQWRTSARSCWRSWRSATPPTCASRCRMRLFGPAHAYGHSIGGRDVATLTRDDVCRFIDAHYAPARAILVVSGSIPGPAVHDITARFGAISRRATGTRAVVRAVAWTGQVSDLQAGVDDPEVLVMFPAAPWGSTESIYDDLIDRIVLQRLRQAARRDSWILDVSLQHLGGDRGGARGFAFRLTDAGRADDAAAKVFTAIHDVPGRYDDDLILALASARQNELLDAFESNRLAGLVVCGFPAVHGARQVPDARAGRAAAPRSGGAAPARGPARPRRQPGRAGLAVAHGDPRAGRSVHRERRASTCRSGRRRSIPRRPAVRSRCRGARTPAR